MDQGQLDLAQKRRLSVRQDIINVILSRGELCKDDIKLMWGLTEEAYANLKEDLADESLIEPGSRGSGGFVAKFKRRPKAPDETTTAPILGTAWEQAAADRLATLLSHAELEELLGDLVYTIRRARAQATGEDRRGNKVELAAALVTQYGIDLFINRDVRALIAKKCKVDCPGRWHPGKGTALRFVTTVGFPEELAGIPAEETPPDFEYLEGRVDLKPLQPFQLEVQRKLLTVLGGTAARAIVTLPTGAGKTRVAVDSLRDWLTNRWGIRQDGIGNTVLWLAHTEELCEQAYACFREVWQASSNVCPLLLFRFWGSFTKDLKEHRDTLVNMSFRPTVVISTPHRLVNLLEDRIHGAVEVLENLKGTTGVILIDEAHRAAAPSYRTIMKAFETSPRKPAMIGLTATPFRQEYSATDPGAGTRDLRELFQQIIEPIETLGENPRAKLEADGFLACPQWTEIKTATLLMAPQVPDVEHITEHDIEKIDHALKIRADNPSRRMLVLEHVLNICDEPASQIIYFGPSVLDAECMAFLLRQKGVAAAFVSGGTRDVTRRKIIADFKSGRIKVLCNCEVLTTGFDAPKVSHVVMARPTVSQVLYEQMIGRGLRGPNFGGTEKCVIVDLEDKYRSERPKLGYQQFRELWRRKESAKA
jgi:superfamily II DNA or RNA helicase